MAMSASTSAARPAARSVAPGSSGLGKLTVGKSGSGANWRGDGVHVGQSGAAQRLGCHRTAHPMQRGQRYPNRTDCRAPQPRRPARCSCSTSRRRRVRPVACAISSANGAVAMAASISRSVGGDDLHAAVQVHLVAVVGRRIVRRGDLDSGRRAGVPDRESQHRCGYRIGSNVTENPSAASTSAVATANCADPCRASRPTITVEPASPRPASTWATAQLARDHDGEVHRVRAAPDRPAQPGGAEFQRTREPGGQLGRIARGELGGRHRIGVVRDPILRCHGAASTAVRPRRPAAHPSGLADRGAGRQHLGMAQRLAGDSGGQVGDQRDPEHLGARGPGGDRLRARWTCRPGRRPASAASGSPRASRSAGRAARRRRPRRAPGRPRGRASAAARRRRRPCRRTARPISGDRAVRFR